MNSKLGKVYTNTQLMKHFHVGVSSGIRIIKGKRGLLLILDVSSKKPRKGRRTYDDYFSNDGEYLYYFGINSKRAPQYYTANNELRRSNLLNKNGEFPLYLIIYTGPDHYYFAGRLHYTNEWKPVSTNWQFKLMAKGQFYGNVRTRTQYVIHHSLIKSFNSFVDKQHINNPSTSNDFKSKKNNDEKEFAQKIIKRVRSMNKHHGPSRPHKNGYHTKAYEYYRGGLIREYAKIVAKGRCGNCGKKAPFIDCFTGRPYLESHHITPRHEGGPDTIWNVIALCPNCHRMMHHAFHSGSQKLLKLRHQLHKKAAERAKKNIL